MPKFKIWITPQFQQTMVPILAALALMNMGSKSKVRFILKWPKCPKSKPISYECSDLRHKLSSEIQTKLFRFWSDSKNWTIWFGFRLSTVHIQQHGDITHFVMNFLLSRFQLTMLKSRFKSDGPIRSVTP